jgi:peroxiredoxin
LTTRRDGSTLAGNGSLVGPTKRRKEMHAERFRLRMTSIGLLLATAALPACKGGAEGVPEAAAPSADQAPVAPAEPAAAAGPASVGAPAPDFALPDLDGKTVRLSDLKGKTVVLEWFNPGCPFVKAAHTQCSIKAMASEQTSEDIAWLAINSGAAGKQGNGVEANREGVETFGMQYPVLIDESGDVGRAYGAKNTPHMFVIAPDGVLAYQGAIDNSPDGTRESPEGGQLVNDVEQALGALRSGSPVATAETKPYGCSVKY